MSSTNIKDKILIILSVLMLLTASMLLIFPVMMDNLITGFASIGLFDVSMTIIHVSLNLSSLSQLSPVNVNGTNVSLAMQAIYYGTGNANQSLDIPTGYACGFGWYVNESGTIKNVTVSEDQLAWETNKLSTTNYLHFSVPPPQITEEVTYTGNSYYEKTFTIDSCCHLLNVSASISVNTSYQDYTLFLIENNTLINKTSEYHLQVSNGTATFYGFNLSNKTFRLQAAPSSDLVERIITTGGGGGGGGMPLPLLDYTPSQHFFIEPSLISIITSKKEPMKAYFRIYNTKGNNTVFTISFTKQFIKEIITSINVPKDEFKNISITLDTSSINPGKYADYVTVKTGERSEKLTIELELLEPEERYPGQFKALSEQQPSTIATTTSPASQIEAEKNQAKLLKIILLVALGLVLMGGAVFLHIRSKSKTIRY